MNKIVKKLKILGKQLLLKLTGKVRHFKHGIDCDYDWYGTIYGGFYVCSKLLDKNSIVYSFGIGEDISFDTALIDKYNCKVFGFDPTPKSINWFKKQRAHENFSFFEFGIGNKSEIVDFFLPKNPNHVSGSAIEQDNVSFNSKIKVQLRSFEDIAKEFGHKQIDVLKMDIEGLEYEVLDSILNTDVKIIQILIEFHDRFFMNGHVKSKNAVAKLQNKGYKLFAISNSYEEASFIKESAL